MVKFPLNKRNIDEYQVKPFKDQPETILNHLENVTTRFKVDLEDHLIDDRTGKGYRVALKGFTDKMSRSKESLDHEAMRIYLHGPSMKKLWVELNSEQQPYFNYYDETSGKLRIYGSRTAYRLTYDLRLMGRDIENAMVDIDAFFRLYETIEVDMERIRVWQQPEIVLGDQSVGGNLTDGRMATGKVHFEPVHIWDIYRYEETEPITHTILSSYKKDFEDEKITN